MLRLGVVVCLLSVCAAQMPPGNFCNMTPMTFVEDFMMSCNNLTAGNSSRCSSIWDTFQSSFADVAPEDVNSSDYEPYFMAVPIQAGVNQSLFWSRTDPLVDILSMMTTMGVNVVSSFNTLSSEILNRITPSEGLYWCGLESGGIDFSSPCLCNVTRRFWHQYSVEFARAASGNGFFLADGENSRGAFRNSSFFSTAELPYMRMGVVTRIVALVVHREGKGEDCATGPTLQVLRNRVSERQFSFDCYDIFAQANDSSTTIQTANCLRNVIDKVQMGTEDANRMISCDGIESTSSMTPSVDGTSALSVSMTGLLILVCICTLFKLD